jgi:hypothetical protein
MKKFTYKTTAPISMNRLTSEADVRAQNDFWLSQEIVPEEDINPAFPVVEIPAGSVIWYDAHEPHISLGGYQVFVLVHTPVGDMWMHELTFEFDGFEFMPE